MKTLIAVAALALVAGGCVYGGFARLPGSMANAPVNEPASTGEYFYPHGGGTKQRTYERASAFEKIKNACEGEYRIDAENIMQDMRVISFTCTRDGGEWAPTMIDAGVLW